MILHVLANGLRETRKLTAPVIKQEEATKYRCKECNKLFRAPEFVIKHVASKHPEHVHDKLEDVSDDASGCSCCRCTL